MGRMRVGIKGRGKYLLVITSVASIYRHSRVLCERRYILLQDQVYGITDGVVMRFHR